MGRTPCCEKEGLKKGPWTPEEDQILISYIRRFGHSNWRTLPKLAGLLRCGKSCRLRWTNYLRPDIKHGDFTTEEEETIINLHQVLGNRWSAIAAKLPGRTDNDVKNFWRTHLKKRLFNNTVMISTNATKEPESKSESEASNLTTTVTAAAILEDKIDQKGENVGNDSLDSDEDLWADVLSDASFSVAVESGFEAQSMVGPPICDVTTINHTWWHEDDFNLDNSLRRSWELPEI